MGVEEAFKKVLGKKYTDKKVRELIDDLSDYKSRTKIDYLEYLNLLEPLNISTNKKLIFKEDTDSVVNNNGKNHVVTNNVNQAGQGTYGTTYRAKTKGLIFKKIVFPGKDDKAPFDFNMFCRETFVESFIQTVLSCDESTYSNNICKIVKMYKDSPVVDNDDTVLKLTNITNLNTAEHFRKLSSLIYDKSDGWIVVSFISKSVISPTTYYVKMSGSTPGKVTKLLDETFTYKLKMFGENATVEKSTDIKPLTDIVDYNTLDKITFYIQLEPLTDSFDSNIIKNHKVSYDTFVRKYLRPLAETLKYYNKYMFYHNDLHRGNIMFKNNDIKIIDFGLSCLVYNHKLYSNYNTTTQGCDSSDLGLFLVSVIQYLEDFLEPTAVTKLKELLNINDFSWKKLEYISEHDSENKKREKKIPMFHIMYTWTGHTKNESVYTNIKLITPDFILSKLDAGKKAKDIHAKAPATCQDLLRACLRKEGGDAENLINKGVDLDCATPEGISPLMVASMYEELDDIAKLLIEKKASLNLVDKKGSSALMHACLARRNATAIALINAGADLTLKDNEDKTVFYYTSTELLKDVREAIRKKLENARKGGGRTRRVKRRNRTRKA